MALMFRAAALAGALVGTTLIAAPGAAAPLPDGPALGAATVVFDDNRYDPAGATAAWGCRWNCGWGGGWGGRRGWRRNRIDAGDVLIGAAVIGGLAAILSSNNRRQRNRDVVVVERDADFRDREQDRNRNWDRRDDRRAAPRGTGASGLDNAVNMCLDRIERDVRVDTVDNVERTAAGWRVNGVLFNGSSFDCRIGNNGQIDGIDFGGSLSAVGLGGSDQARPLRADDQWSDQRYADARAAIGGTVRPDMAVSETVVQVARGAEAGTASMAPSTVIPTYPGGPVPGEVIPETIDGDIGG
ncbi:MAG: hypothetical protein EAY70_06385 [Sphingomonadales bacterium]|nr:MAG: hypothetical protein EAY70_06385 [Sphingomonadales bacterium]